MVSQTRVAITAMVKQLIDANTVAAIYKGIVIKARTLPSAGLILAVGDSVILENVPRSSEWYIVASRVNTYPPLPPSVGALVRLCLDDADEQGELVLKQVAASADDADEQGELVLKQIAASADDADEQ